MSTNYYWHRNICSCCHRYDAVHIGHQASLAWSFEGHFVGEGISFPITSWQEWKTALRSEGEIFNEYQQKVGVEEFITQVEQANREERRRQYNWLAARRSVYGDRMDKVEPGYDWLCPDGFSFHGGEFS